MRYEENCEKEKNDEESCCKGINIVNETQREVAIGKIGVAAGEFANVAIVGEDGAAAAGSEAKANEE